MPLAATRRLGRWLRELASVTDEPGKITRTFLSPAMRRANAVVGKWMREAGLKVREDGVGNLIGRQAALDPRAKTLLLGSHLDTVRDGGAYDGALGVLLPITACAELKRRGVTLPFNVEVIGFSEEEGVRFSSAYLGSKGYTGQIEAEDLRRRDAAGISVQAALSAYRRAVSTSTARAPRDVLGYVETHIEQGPVLEARNLAVGVVSAIAGQTRGQLTFTGRAGHAGTTPMGLRRDALAAAAEFVLRVEALARKAPGLVATVGTLVVEPGVPNVIPGRVTCSLEVRHPRDGARHAGLEGLLGEARGVARRRKLEFTWQRTQDNGAVGCHPGLTDSLRASVRAIQGRDLTLVSGAGHDAVVMAKVTGVAMLFVRCRAGVSHHPSEYASPQDIDVALRVGLDFLQRLADDQR